MKKIGKQKSAAQRTWLVPTTKNIFTASQIDCLNSLITRFSSVYLVNMLGGVYLLPRHWQHVDARPETMLARRGLLLFKGTLPNKYYYIYGHIN